MFRDGHVDYCLSAVLQADQFARIVQAARIDTIAHTFLIIDSTSMRPKTMHEINVIGTMNLFAAASTPDSTVRNVIVKSATAGRFRFNDLVLGVVNSDAFRRQGPEETKPQNKPTVAKND